MIMGIKEIKEISIDFFSKTDISAELNKIMKTYEQIQEAAAAVNSTDGKQGLVKIRIGTILTFGIINNISNGKWPKNYAKDDWLDLLNAVSEYAVDIDDQDYSAFIFKMYAEYIDASAGVLAGRVPEDTLDPIISLAEELREKTELFQNSGLGEVDYTEECLWICLDAVIKLLAANFTKYAGSEIGNLAEGLSSVAFEYGRLMLYRKEQELLKQYIDNQNVLDDSLQKKYEDYLRELDAQADVFRGLINNAFDPDFRNALQGSIEFARAAGVSEDEILKSSEEVDSFFLD
jgi:hypothetical protein